MSDQHPRSSTTLPSETLLSVRGLTKAFPIYGGVLRRKVGEVRALSDVNIDVPKGKTLGIVGESGCGKSTFSRVVNLLTPPSKGEMLYNFEGTTKELASLNRKERFRYRELVQMVFQDPFSAFNPRQLIETAFHEPLRVHGVKTAGDREKRIEEAFDMVSLPLDFLNRLPHQLSGGQRQRLSIARALCMRPELIINDEPVSALDVSVQAQILNYLRDIQEAQNLTYIFIAHDLAVVQYMSDEIAVMYLGKVVETFESENLEECLHPYTRALISAIPEPKVDGPKRERIVLEGEVPSPLNMPEGCPFVTRCPVKVSICSESNPALQSVKPKHQVACHLYKQ
ncbi:MAG: ABC transporter ATP-binding protein [Actinomycetaceae bacterium]|nr:ABC transporter ATP-binding protein [Actinomycetaceae bacterium]